MKLVLVTGYSPAEKYVAVNMVASANVMAVLSPKRRSAYAKIRTALNHPAYALTRLSMFAPWEQHSDMTAAVRKLSPDADRLFESIHPTRIHEFDDVNSQACIDLIGRLRPDAIVCFGGPIYSGTFIRSARLVLNFHTGISPIYNGARAMAFVFARGDFGLCGATLMQMSTTIDGGDILTHYLPSIEEDDSPGSLLIKCARALPQLCLSFLGGSTFDGNGFTAVPQDRPRHYFRSRQWTMAYARSVARYIKSGAIRSHVRREQTHEYWRLPPAVARALLDSNIVGWSTDATVSS
jgi:formyl transferase-like protein